MEYKLSEHETKADVPEVDGGGSQGLPRALDWCHLGISPSSDLNRRSVVVVSDSVVSINVVTSREKCKP